MHPSTASHIRGLNKADKKSFYSKIFTLYISYLSDMTRYAREFYKFLSEHIH